MRRGINSASAQPREPKVPGAPRFWAYLAPTLSVLAFALVITLPWGFGPNMLYVPPMLIMATVFAWVVRRPHMMPSVLVFMVGIAVDVVTASPVGFWAFLFLLAYAAALHLVEWEFEWKTWATIVGFVLTSSLVGGMAWGLTSVYFGQMTSWEPVYESVKTTWFVCPFIAFAVRAIDTRMHTPTDRAVPVQVPK